MSSWHITHDGPTLTLSRGVPARFDISATARFPDANRRLLASQIRQDMWRRLQRLRGFRPVVEVTRDAQGLTVRAGGAVEGRVPPHAQAALQDLLTDPAFRARWLRCARPSAKAATP